METITVEQGARYLAISNLAMVGLLADANTRSGKSEHFHIEGHATWSPKTGDEIDRAFALLKRSVESDTDAEALDTEAACFRKDLQRSGKLSRRCSFVDHLAQLGLELADR